MDCLGVLELCCRLMDMDFSGVAHGSIQQAPVRFLACISCLHV